MKFKPLVVLQARVCVSVECHRTGRMMTCQIARSKKLGKYLRPEKQTQKNPFALILETYACLAAIVTNVSSCGKIKVSLSPLLVNVYHKESSLLIIF